MNDRDCVEFLQWALPRLRMRWAGFRKVRRQVCKRVSGRMAELALHSAGAYRGYLESHPEEWSVLDACCHITISRFYRDRGVFEFLRGEVLPALAKAVMQRRERVLRVLCVGAASGEEPYSIAILWRSGLAQRFPDVALHIVATECDAAMLARAKRAVYTRSSVKDLPAPLREAAFEEAGEQLALKPEFRADVTFARSDIREAVPAGLFDLILCRNVVFTYFDDALQRELLGRLVERLRRGAALVIGIHEHLPEQPQALAPWSELHRVYWRRVNTQSSPSESSSSKR